MPIYTQEQKDKIYLVVKMINEGYITFTNVKASRENNEYLDEYFRKNPDLFRLDEARNRIYPTKMLMDFHKEIQA